MPTLASILRPETLDDYIGQTHLLGKNQPLAQAVEKGHIFSMLFWGPPGVGKTTLANILAKNSNRDFYALSAVSASKNDIRKIVQQTEQNQDLLGLTLPPVLFLDEIHRFNKAQQDYLLPFVEDGTLILIGATTENPSFEVIGALLSRTKVFVLEPLSESELEEIILRALQHLELDKKNIDQETKEWLITYASGDARKLLTLLDHTYQLYQNLTKENFEKTLQSSFLNYDKKGEEHYNTISAFIKSMRASDADAALYYLARMVAAGEDPKFIARRMVIFASEDIGLAVPTALVVANAVFEAVMKIGYPEAQINLAHGVAYLCKCQKNRASYDAYFAALADVKKYGNLPVPLHLRNAPTKLMQNTGYGKGYTMYPDKDKNLLPQKLKGRRYIKL